MKKKKCPFTFFIRQCGHHCPLYTDLISASGASKYMCALTAIAQRSYESRPTNLVKVESLDENIIS